LDNLLLLVHRIPYPPNKGDKIRSYHLLQHLARHYRVHLATFVDDADDWQHVPRVQALCASSHFAPLGRVGGRLRSLGALLGGSSLSLGYYRDAGLRAWVASTMQREAIGRIVVFSSAMAQYAEAYPAARRVVDFVDVDSDKWAQYAARKRWPMAALYAHEARQLLAYERRVALQCDAALFVSEPEAALFRTLAPESAARIGHVSNGVDTVYFAPGVAIPDPYTAAGIDPAATLVFTGAMDYWPNIDAVTWFAREVLPALRQRHPVACFCIVGARPAAEVQQLAVLPGVLVTGTVPDVRPYLAHAALCVAPLRIARGIQNKVLEAMSMARTVLVSPQALEGIDAVLERELLLSDGAAAWIDACASALARPQPAIGLAARARVEADYAWSSHLARIDTLLERPAALEAVS